MTTQPRRFKRLAQRCAASAGFTCDPSPRSHVYRLLALLALAFWLFLQIKAWATPETWDPRRWHRAAAVEELKHLPAVLGGNASCTDCHRERAEEFAAGSHRSLACESCHGPVGAHAAGGLKIAVAPIDRNRTMCLQCHAKMISRPKEFGQYSEGLHRSMGVAPDKACLDCHKSHSPKYEIGWGGGWG